MKFVVNWVVYVEKIYRFTWRIGHLIMRTPKTATMKTRISSETKRNWSLMRVVIKDGLELTRPSNEGLRLKNGPFPSNTDKVVDDSRDLTKASPFLIYFPALMSG